MDVKRDPVKSSNVASIGYARADYDALKYPDGAIEVGIVEVEFKADPKQFEHGAIYRHVDVPRSVYDAVRSNPSVGAAYNVALRGKYGCQKIADAERKTR